MKALVYHPDVEVEITEAALYYDAQSRGLGKRFLDSYEGAVTEIQAHPLAWPMFEPPYRRHQMRHFPHGIVYRVLPETIRVLACMHLHRKPGYWKGRT